jgi:predicted transcriptional regulator
MVYLHILGNGKTPSEISDSKGHLFERLIRDLFEHLKMSVKELNQSQNGKEIDIDGITLVGKVKFFAECKAQADQLDSTDIQKFGFKFLTKKKKDNDVKGFLFTLSNLNPKAQEVWDADLLGEYPDQVDCYRHNDIVELLTQHYKLFSPESIRQNATNEYQRDCGDTQILCVEADDRSPQLFWAQLLMSSDGTEPSAVVFYSPDGKLINERKTIDRLLKLKPDLAVGKLLCLNTSISSSILDDISPSRSVGRVRMSSGWFDYRFPAAPEFFVGRSSQLTELQVFFRNVRDGKTSIRGFLVSGKSGIGKSSFALKARYLLQKEKIVFLPIDSRLCDDISFLYDAVNELLFELKQVPDLQGKLDAVRVYGLDSLINTLVDIHKVIAQEGYLSVLFFDQLEKVFEYPDVASAIRTLFLRITEKQLFVLFGFAWKSDLWSLAEGFPHQERDDIVREALPIRTLTQFGQEETVEIIKQLEIQWGSKLSIVLTRQLADFSRGLPWLLKKVCAHLLEKKSQGVTESELIETNLKLQDLFEADLAGLDDEERSLLRTIAPLLPTTLRRISESFEISNIDQSLHRFIDKRILVKITEDIGDSLANVKYDAYSDIFREFLITGNVPIEDAFYFFTYPQGAFKFFDKVRERGKLSIEEELAETGKQMASIYNLSRDLRSLNLVNLRNRIFSIAKDVENLEQEEIISFLQIQLKRNRVVSLILSELNENGSMTRSHLADLLQEIFPSVQAVEKTWDYYSKTTSQWLHYARLVFYNKKDYSLRKVDDEAIFEAAISRGRILITGYRFPMCFRNSIKDCLERTDALGGEVTIQQLMEEFGLSHQSIEKVLSDCINLQFIQFDEDTKKYNLNDLGTEFARSSEKIRRKLFNQQCINVPVFNRFVFFIEAAGDKGINSKIAANYVTQEMKLDLAELTIEKLGAMLANWAEYAEAIDKRGRLCFSKGHLPEQFSMF